MPPESGDLNEQLEFEERIKTMSLDDRTVFIAKQVYALTTKVECLSVGGISKKASATSGGITAGIIVGVIEGLKALLGKG